MLKIRQLYYVLLVTGLLPLILVVGSFSFWLVTGDDSASAVTSGLILFSIGFLLINLVFIFVYYDKARKQNNPQAISRTLFFIGLFLSNLVTDIIVYNYMSYATTTVTISIENEARYIVKKMFFTNGDEKYFIAPVEPKEKTIRALTFNDEGRVEGEVNYTFDLNGMTYNGVLFENVASSLGKQFSFSIYRNGRVKILDQSMSVDK